LLSTSVTSTSSPPSLSSSGSSSSILPSPVLVTIPSIGMFTEPGPSIFATTPYHFVPFPSPSLEPLILGMYPAISPKHPPPVESPALVPNFAPAWTRAYQKAKARVSLLNPLEAANLLPSVCNDEQLKWLSPFKFVPRLCFSSINAVMCRRLTLTSLNK
jgi:hypothetical protein